MFVLLTVLGSWTRAFDNTIVSITATKNHVSIPRLRKDSIVKIRPDPGREQHPTTVIDFSSTPLRNIRELELTNLGKVSLTGLRGQNLAISHLVLTDTQLDTETDVTHCGAISAKTIADLHNLILPEISKLSIRQSHPLELGIELSSDTITVIQPDSSQPITVTYSRSFPPFTISSHIITITITDSYATCPKLNLTAPARVFVDRLPDSPKEPIVYASGSPSTVEFSGEADLPVVFYQPREKRHPVKLPSSFTTEYGPLNGTTTCTSIEFTNKLTLTNETVFALCTHEDYEVCQKHIEDTSDKRNFQVINGPSEPHNYFLLCVDSRQYISFVPGENYNAEGKKVLGISIGVCAAILVAVNAFSSAFINRNIDIEECEREVDQIMASRKPVYEAMEGIKTSELNELANGDLYAEDAF